MKTKLLYFSLTLLFILSCNLPNSATQPSLSIEDQATTLIAATLTEQARNINPAPVVTFTASQTQQPTNTSGPTTTITPTYSVPMLTLREQTNCRTGPGLDYPVLFSYVKSVRLEIIGYYPKNNYWLVKSKESPTGECWIWGEYADITGSYWLVPTLTPPPTATIPLPKAPAVKWEFFCNYATGQMDVSFTWTDHANNETGYRVIRNEQVIAELPANSTAYKDTYIFVAGEKVIYFIEVYNITGSTRSAAVSLTC
jgi:hypothetical protein